jgi:predicted dehydrogenase
MTVPLSVAVIGAGFWAREMHLPAFARIPDAQVTRIVSATSASAKRAAEQFGVPAYGADLEAAIADPAVDVIDIVAPPDVHARAVHLAAQHGKDAICIKPLGRNLDEADTMLADAAAAGIRLLYAENVPFIPAVQKARRLVDAGHIGDVYRVKACEGIGEPHSAWFYDTQRSGGGAMIDMAVHSIEFCRFFADAAVATAYAEVGTFVWGAKTPAEDTAIITLRFDNGVIGQCEDSWSLAGAMDSRFEIFGTTGRILIDNLHRQPLQVVSTTGSAAGEGGWSYPMPIPGMVADGHLDMLTHFIGCIRTGEPSRSEGAAGRDVLAVVDAATRSAVSGRRENVRHMAPPLAVQNAAVQNAGGTS